MNRRSILSPDTSAEAERLQVEIWRGMSSMEKLQLVAEITRAADELALAGIRQRHPDASERECFLRLALLRLGPDLFRATYPESADLIDR